MKPQTEKLRWVPRAAYARRWPPRDHRRAAFTLIEIIAVIIILGVFAALVVPRIFDDGSRSAKAEAQSVQRLLTAVAERDWTGGGGAAEDLALELLPPDSASGRGPVLRLISRSTSLDVSSEKTSKGTRSGASAWFEDRLTPPLELRAVQLRSASADGGALPASSVGWRVAIRSGSGAVRPAVRLTLAGAGGDAGAGVWVAVLERDAAAATLDSGDSASAPSARVMDLDLTGRGDKPW